jgi:hypothetical protein
MLRHKKYFLRGSRDLTSASIFFNRRLQASLELITEHHVPARSRHLVENVKALRNQILPVRHPALFDDQEYVFR